jgi:hypothetical protein
MFRILSIDWDVFHDMTSFMPGGMECEQDWVVEYSRWEGEFANGIYKMAFHEYDLLREYLKQLNQPVHIADDHHVIYNLVPRGSDVHLVHLDFHGDAGLCEKEPKYIPSKGFIWKPKSLWCGNWISALISWNDCKVRTDWRQLHSKHDGKPGVLIPGDQRVEMGMTWRQGFDYVFQGHYDLVFLCQSYLYSPPHMNHYFRLLVDTCREPVIDKHRPPFYPTYTNRYESLRKYERAYFPTGQETAEEMDAIHDDDDLSVIWPVEQLRNIKDCCPIYRR